MGTPDLPDDGFPRGLSTSLLARLLFLAGYCFCAAALAFGRLPPQDGCGLGLMALMFFLWALSPLALLSAVLDLRARARSTPRPADRLAAACLAVAGILMTAGGTGRIFLGG